MRFDFSSSKYSIKLLEIGENSTYNELLEYIVIIHRNGLPIYAKSYVHEYTNYLQEKYLLYGFLSAIINFPRVLGFGYNNKDLKSLDIGQSRLMFYYTENDIVIVTSTKIANLKIHSIKKKLNQLLKELKLFFETEFTTEDWSLISIQLSNKLNYNVDSIISNNLI